MPPLQVADSVAAQLKRPSERAIAFAISIVSSKPNELSVREYIHLLRQHIAKGRRDSTVSATNRHLDRSSYWRAQYERLKGDLKTAEDETIDLKREIDQLNAKLDAAKPIASVKKRKKVDEDVVMVPRSPKKAKTVASLAKGRDSHVEEDQFDFSDVGEAGVTLMRALYQTHASLKSRDLTEPVILAHHLVRAASALPQVVHKLIKQSLSAPVADPSSMKFALTATTRSVLSLVVGINRLSRAANGAEVLGSVVYAFVQMFSSLLNALEKGAALEIELAMRAEFDPSSSQTLSSSKSKAKAKIKQSKSAGPKDNATLSIITSFLCSVIDLLNANSEVHQSLFEGFAYCILNKLGTSLYTTTFGHARGVTIEAEIAASDPIDEIEDSSSQGVAPPTGEEKLLRQSKLEAPCLIRLLTHMMKAAPAHLGASLGAQIGRAKKADDKGSMNGTLAVVAKERLQRTLVNCMFGTEGVDESDPFLDCLKAPVQSGPALPVSEVKEAEVQEWFKEEVWKLLGWDILAKEGGW